MIGAQPFAAELSAEGLDDMEKRIAVSIAQQLPGGDVTFSVRTGGARGAATNRLIAAVQAGRRRNPFFLNDRALVAITQAARGLASTVAETVQAAEETVKALILISIGENVAAQRNPDGSSFTQLTANYAAAKRRKFGFVLPILKATGDLLGGLRVTIERTRD